MDNDYERGPTLDRVRSLFDYDQASGRLTSKSGFAVSDRPNLQGYLRVTVDGRRYLQHRLIWFFVYGKFPSEQVDHIDGDRTNNAIANLRHVSNMKNAQNIRRAHRDSKTGLLGVAATERGTWEARIQVNGRRTCLGSTFKTPEEAHAVYLDAKRRLHEGCTI